MPTTPIRWTLTTRSDEPPTAEDLQAIGELISSGDTDGTLLRYDGTGPTEVGTAGQLILSMTEAPDRVSSAWGRRFACRIPDDGTYAVIDVAFYIQHNPTLPLRPSVVQRTAYLICLDAEDVAHTTVESETDHTIVATDSALLVPGGPPPAAEVDRCAQLCTGLDPLALNWNHRIFPPPHTWRPTW